VAAPLVALVNDAAVRKCWPGHDALGQRITITEKEQVVVGVSLPLSPDGKCLLSCEDDRNVSSADRRILDPLRPAS